MSEEKLTELQILQAKQSAEFALTPVGQTVKQFEVMQRMAQMYTTSTIVPDRYKGNIGNCVIALDMAMRMGCNPLMCMQNLYIVNGDPSFSSKFLIATINASGRFSPLRYEFKGEEGTPQYGCRCVAYESSDKEHKEPLHGDWITISMADKEGWITKKGSKWQSMPSQMLRYRAAAFWQRAYCPEISMGLLTKEELEETLSANMNGYKLGGSNISDFINSDDYYESDDIYQICKDSFYAVILHNEKLVDSGSTSDMGNDTLYIGFYISELEYADMLNVMTANYAGWTLKGQTE